MLCAYNDQDFRSLVDFGSLLFLNEPNAIAVMTTIGA